MPPLSQQAGCRKFDIDLLDRLGASTITTSGMPQTLHGSTRLPIDASKTYQTERCYTATITTSGMPQTLHGSTRPKDAIQQLSQQAECRKVVPQALRRLNNIEACHKGFCFFIANQPSNSSKLNAGRRGAKPQGGAARQMRCEVEAQISDDFRF